MKTQMFKFMIPIAAVVFAAGSAFTTLPQNGESLATINGYANTSTPCSVPITCSTVNTGTLCKDSNQKQVYGKFNPSDTACPRVVYRP